MLSYDLTGYIAAVLFGIILGFLSAIPAGAVQIQVIRSSLRGHRNTAVAIALGSGVSDLTYGLLTLMGLGGFLMSARFQIWFYALGVAVLCFMLARSVRDYRRPDAGRTAEAPDCRRVGFLTGFTLAITNPSIVLWWIVGFKVFLDLGLSPGATVMLRIAFVLAGAGGLSGYLIILAMVIHRVHHAIPDTVFRRMNLALIAVFVALTAYFIYQFVLHVR